MLSLKRDSKLGGAYNRKKKKKEVFLHFNIPKIHHNLSIIFNKLTGPMAPDWNPPAGPALELPVAYEPPWLNN